MKKIINISLFMALVCAFSFVNISCSDDDDESTKPKITDFECSPAVNPGKDLHVETNITAVEKIKRIDVEIHSESDSDYEINETYTNGKYIDVQNTLFHEHIDIPQDAPLGEYHLHFTVTDGKGQTTSHKCHIEVTDQLLIHNDDHDDE